MGFRALKFPVLAASIVRLVDVGTFRHVGVAVLSYPLLVHNGSTGAGSDDVSTFAVGSMGDGLVVAEEGEGMGTAFNVIRGPELRRSVGCF